jgi:hypothetical protein
MGIFTFFNALSKPVLETTMINKERKHQTQPLNEKNTERTEGGK